MKTTISPEAKAKLEEWLNKPWPDAAYGRMYRDLANHCLRPAKHHFNDWQRHKRNVNIAMATDHEFMMWVRLFDWADYDLRARLFEAAK